MTTSDPQIPESDNVDAPEQDSEQGVSDTVGRSMTKNSVLLGLFALLTAGLLATTYTQTADRIAAAERKSAQQALLEIIPAERHDNELLDTTQSIAPQYWSTLGLKKGGEMNIALRSQQPIAAIIPAVAADGYGGDIRMIVGVNRDGSVAGVRVLGHTETPGLGDKIEIKKGDWILSFDGRSLTADNVDSWTVRKDGGEFDQFTGATITPRAVVHQVRRVLEVFNASQPLSETVLPITEEVAEHE